MENLSNAVVEVAVEGEYLGRADSARIINLPARAAPNKKRKAQRRAKGGIRRYVTPQGKVRWQAQLRGLIKGRRIPSQSFDTEAEAQAYIDEKVVEVPVLVVAGPGEMTMPQLFDAYIAQCALTPRPLPKGQVYQFNRLAKHPVLKNLLVSEMDASKAYEYCNARVKGLGCDERGRQVKPVHSSTVMSEFIRITVALQRVGVDQKWAQKVNNVLIPFNPLVGAMDMLRQKGLVSDSNRRDRRPSKEELNALLGYFRGDAYAKRNVAHIPMADIMAIAAINGFRRGEIVRMQWSKFDSGNDGCFIGLDRKDSNSQGGRRDTLVPVIEQARKIIERQRERKLAGDDRIFPYNFDTITQHFEDACAALGIEDLRFHDLRHEAISTLALVLGMTEAMLISGHKTAKAFLVYCQHDEDAKKIAKKASASIKLKTEELLAA
jgi:integrase